MYTTNALESVNASFRKVVRRGSFPSEEAVMKLLYLRVLEPYRKWGEGCHHAGWSHVRNQLPCDEGSGRGSRGTCKRNGTYTDFLTIPCPRKLAISMFSIPVY